MEKICNEIEEALNVSEGVKGFKDKFPKLHKLMVKEGALDMADNAESVKKVTTKGGDIFVVKTEDHSNYFHLKYGWVGEEDDGLDHEEMEKHADEFNKNIKKSKPQNITEAQHYNTKVRGIAENMGSRKIRLGVKETLKSVKNMLNEKHSSPNPLTDKDRKLLTECSTLLEQAIPRLRDVKETKRKVKK